MPDHFSLPLDAKTLQELSKPHSASSLENLEQPLYDTLLYEQGVTTHLTFFQQADNNQGAFTNMEQGGMLPNDQWMMPYTVEFSVYGLLAGDQANIAALQRLLEGQTAAGGVPGFKYRYNTKSYPQEGLVPLTDAYVQSAVNGFTTRTATEFIKSSRTRGWSFGQDQAGRSLVVLKGGQSFNFTAVWPEAVTLPVNVYIRCTLRGTYYRQVQ